MKKSHVELVCIDQFAHPIVFSSYQYGNNSRTVLISSAFPVSLDRASQLREIAAWLTARADEMEKKT
jgi:hypothetical protein